MDFCQCGKELFACSVNSVTPRQPYAPHRYVVLQKNCHVSVPGNGPRFEGQCSSKKSTIERELIYEFYLVN